MPAKRKTRSSTASPDEKRTRGVSEDDGESSEAPEMTEPLDVGAQLKRVLHKLEKLDIIESRLNNVCSTMANIEETLSRLDRDVKKLKEKTKAIDKSVVDLEESINFNEDDISDLKKNAKMAELELKEWKKQVLYLEAYSRRENVKFVGIPEDTTANKDHNVQPEDTKDIIYNFMENELNIDNPRGKIVFQRIHRLGKPKTSGPRPIIARFLRYSDKEEVMSKARVHLKGTDFAVFDDIPKELYELRKKQQKKFKDARERGFKVHFSKARPDQLFINGKYTAPEEPL